VSHGYRQTEGLRICNVMFQQRFIGENSADLGRLTGYQALFQVEPFLAREYCFKSRLHLSVPEQEQAEALIRELTAEYQRAVSENEAGCRTMVRSRFLEMVVLLSRWYQRLDPPDSGSPINLAKAVAFMEGHYSQDIDLGVIAAQAGLSPRHFSRLFNESYGVSPIHYLIRIRLRKACALLENTDDSVIDVSLECGFQDSNHFSRQFRQTLGLSPSDWRKRRKV
jgi:AraC-like DNA-binding protein